MKSLNHGQESDDMLDLPPVPLFIHTIDGQVIDTSPSIWRMREHTDGGNTITINWEAFGRHKQGIAYTRRAVHLCKLHIADRIQRRKARTAFGDFENLLRFERWIAEHINPSMLSSDVNTFNWSNLNEGIAREFLDWCVRNTSSKGHWFSQLRVFYEWGVARQYSDFRFETLRILKSIKAAGALKGHNVRFHHPIKGPFSPDEKRLIISAIDNNRGRDQDRAIIMLHLELGINPLATTQLRNSDLKHFEMQNDDIYQIDVPRIKKRISHRETKRRPISKKLGCLLCQLMQGKPEDRLFHWLNEKAPEDAVRTAMLRFVSTARLISPRTGEPLHVSPRRFRYTLATHMAEEGASKFHIAEILDHTDLQNVEVYVETVSSIADSIAMATDLELGFLVRRFLGKIVDSTQTPAFPGLPNQIVPPLGPHLSTIPLLNVGGVGVCGRDVRKDGLCGLFPPLSCYLCPSFAALRTGPHQEVLESIEQFIRDGTGKVDERILRQLDDIRLAILEVVTRLKATTFPENAGAEQ